MAQRNLTLNVPAYGDPVGDPFGDSRDSPVPPAHHAPPRFLYDGNSDQPYDRGSYSSTEQETYPVLYSSQDHRTSEYNDGVHDVLDAPRQNGQNVRNNFVAPLNLNRFPLLPPSREVSSVSLASQFENSYTKYPTNGYKRISPNGSLASSSSPLNDPFTQALDVSPFGGYPASLFPLHIDEKEDDDYLHNPDPLADSEYDKNRFLHDLKHMDRRSAWGLVGLIILFISAGCVFILLPILTYSGVTSPYKPLTYEILTRYQYPVSAAIRTSLVDPDTPQTAYTKKTRTGENWVLTFSDEFNVEGRTFYPGDDQFFEAVDLNYYATKDLEWYDPDAATTKNGSLLITLDAIKNHDLFYRSAMVQSWNKLCFTQGLIVTSASLPGYGNVSGLWPGLWTLGNLARPGYLATSEGVWPYTYDSCDAGITANQSSPDGISYLPGQKLNSCTCPGEDHPNRGTGRGAPEIDIVEGATDTHLFLGVVSQSYQMAPMDIWYIPDYNFVEVYNFGVSTMNTYTGGPVQQALSCVTTLNVTWYELGANANKFQEYGFEYLNNNDKGYITWYVGQDPTFTVYSYALGPNGNVGFRRISKEPMSIVMNLGLSNNWAYIDWPSLQFPLHMRVNYVRVYQPSDSISMTCDPPNYPTTNYINSHLAAYMNNNHTSWKMAGFTYPKNKISNGC